MLILLLPQELGKMGYKFQFVTLAGFHALNHSMFQLSKGYAARGMAAYSELQQEEFAAEKDGYTATRCALIPLLAVVPSRNTCSGACGNQQENTEKRDWCTAWVDSIGVSK